MNFDKHARSYSDDLERSIPVGFRTIEYFSTYKVKLARRFARTSPTRVLDFGCGIGQCSIHLATEFPDSEVVGFDISEDSLDIARTRVPQVLFTSNWNDVSTKKFDLIFTSNVFHHINPSEQLLWLDRLKTALNPEGTVVIFEHNPINPLTRMVFKRCIFDQDAAMIGQANFLKLAKKAGFGNRSSKFTLFFPGPLRFLAPLEKFLGWLPLGAQYYLALQIK